MQMLKMRTGAVSCAIVLAALFALAQGCAPRAVYRRPASPAPRAPAPPPPPQAAPPAARVEPPPVPKPLPEEPKIREQNLPNNNARVLKEPSPAPPEVVKEPPISPPEIAADPGPPAPLPDDSSLIAKITAGTHPRRAASLRLAEEGRKLVDEGAPAKGLPRLEQSLAIDSTNPYAYFYLAKAHYRLGRYRESLNFLDVAESRLSGEAYWMAEVYALRGENFRALGMSDRAEASYGKALSINPGNHTAMEATSRPQSIPAAGTR